MKFLKTLLILQLLLFCVSVSAQVIKTIRVKKDTYFAFYQKGNKADTISKNKGDVFYMIVPDTLKQNFSIDIYNGQLIKTDNDSLYRLIYVNAIRYEGIFVSVTDKDKIRYEYKTLINGVSSEPPNSVKLSFKVSGVEKPLLEDKFYYKN